MAPRIWAGVAEGSRGFRWTLVLGKLNSIGDVKDASLAACSASLRLPALPLVARRVYPWRSRGRRSPAQAWRGEEEAQEEVCKVI